MKPKALILDMDGVVIDSNPVHREAWVAFNSSHGIETTDAMLARMYGKRNDEIIRDFFGKQISEEALFARGAEKEALYRKMVAPGLIDALVPGIRGFLEMHQDLPVALATNAEAANADFVLGRAGLRHLFRLIVDGHQVTHAKPHPEIYLKTAELLHVTPRECVVFEDSYAGVEAGRAAGMAVVGIQTTHTELPGTVLEISNFLDPALERWLGKV